MRVASAVGDNLSSDTSLWFERVFSATLNEHYGMTEHGMLLCNHHHPSISSVFVPEPDTIGVPLPGYSLTLVNSDGGSVDSGTVGQIVVDKKLSPLLWFKNYWNQPQDDSS